jgi:hypothetical protein
MGGRRREPRGEHPASHPSPTRCAFLYAHSVACDARDVRVILRHNDTSVRFNAFFVRTNPFRR